MKLAIERAFFEKLKAVEMKLFLSLSFFVKAFC